MFQRLITHTMPISDISRAIMLHNEGKAIKIALILERKMKFSLNFFKKYLEKPGKLLLS